MHKLADDITRLHMVVPTAWIERVDAWRAKQPTPMTRSEAIRQMVDATTDRGLHYYPHNNLTFETYRLPAGFIAYKVGGDKIVSGTGTTRELAIADLFPKVFNMSDIASWVDG